MSSMVNCIHNIFRAIQYDVSKVTLFLRKINYITLSQYESISLFLHLFPRVLTFSCLSYSSTGKHNPDTRIIVSNFVSIIATISQKNISQLIQLVTRVHISNVSKTTPFQKANFKTNISHHN